MIPDRDVQPRREQCIEAGSSFPRGTQHPIFAGLVGSQPQHVATRDRHHWTRTAHQRSTDSLIGLGHVVGRTGTVPKGAQFAPKMAPEKMLAVKPPQAGKTNKLAMALAPHSCQVHTMTEWGGFSEVNCSPRSLADHGKGTVWQCFRNFRTHRPSRADERQRLAIAQSPQPRRS